MTPPETTKALIWTEQFLCFSKELTHDQRREWLRAAIDYTRDDWAEGIRKYYKEMKTDFRPPLGKVLQHMPAKEVKARECPLDGFIEDPNWTTPERTRAWHKFRGYGKFKLGGGK